MCFALGYDTFSSILLQTVLLLKWALLMLSMDGLDLNHNNRLMLHAWVREKVKVHCNHRSDRSFAEYFVVNIAFQAFKNNI